MKYISITLALAYAVVIIYVLAACVNKPSDPEFVMSSWDAVKAFLVFYTFPLLLGFVIGRS